MSAPSIINSSVAYSAKVRMHLVIGFRRLAIAQIGPDFMMLAEPLDLPASRGELVVEIDGDVKRRAIFLPDGVRSTDVQTRVAPA